MKKQHKDNLWENKAFIADLDRRTAEYESDKTKVLTLDQLEAGARGANKTEDDFEYQFTDEEIKLFEERRAKHLSGESKTYSWEEVKNIIINHRRIKNIRESE